MVPEDWRWKIISTHRSALNRQVTEAVLIQEMGKEITMLNSKLEFGANILTEATVTNSRGDKCEISSRKGDTGNCLLYTSDAADE